MSCGRRGHKPQRRRNSALLAKPLQNVAPLGTGGREKHPYDFYRQHEELGISVG